MAALAGTNQVHRAVLQLLEPTNFEAFMAALARGRPDPAGRHVRLVLESLQEDSDTDPTLRRLGDVLTVVPRGFVANYLTNGRNGPGRSVVLRSVTGLAAGFGPRAEEIQSRR